MQISRLKHRTNQPLKSGYSKFQFQVSDTEPGENCAMYVITRSKSGPCRFRVHRWFYNGHTLRKVSERKCHDLFDARGEFPNGQYTRFPPTEIEKAMGVIVETWL